MIVAYMTNHRSRAISHHTSNQTVIWARAVILMGSVIALILGFSFSAQAQTPEACSRIPKNNDVYRVCLIQWGTILDARVRHALDKALIMASERDRHEGAEGYGKHVRTLDRKQQVWEEIVDATCHVQNDSEDTNSGRKQDLDAMKNDEIECWIDLYQRRLKEITITE